MPSNLEIIKLNDLRLAARLISEQLRQGIHSGIRVGVGSEFEQYRHYQPGDDLKRIDWKYFSRSGKYMIKESTTESNLQIRLMLDLSGSMNYAENGVSGTSGIIEVTTTIEYEIPTDNQSPVIGHRHKITLKNVTMTKVVGLPELQISFNLGDTYEFGEFVILL